MCDAHGKVDGQRARAFVEQEAVCWRRLRCRLLPAAAKAAYGRAADFAPIILDHALFVPRRNVENFLGDVGDRVMSVFFAHILFAFVLAVFERAQSPGDR